MSDQRRLRRMGALWKPKPGAKSLGTGTMTINGWRQRFVILKNDRKVEGSRDPDYMLLSSEAPEPDDYASGRTAKSEPGDEATDDDIPF